MEEGLELGHHPPGDLGPFHGPASPLYSVPVEDGCHVEEGLELGPHPLG